MFAAPKLTWRWASSPIARATRSPSSIVSCFTTKTIAYRCAGETLGTMYGFAFAQAGRGDFQPAAQARASEFQVNDDGLLVWVGPGNTYTEGETKKLWGTSTTIGTTNYGWGMPILAAGSDGQHRSPENRRRQRRASTTASRTTSPGTICSSTRFWTSMSAATSTTRPTSACTSTDVAATSIRRASRRKTEEDRRTTTSNLYSANNPIDYFVEDAGFVKLREVSCAISCHGSFVGSIVEASAPRAHRCRSSAVTCSPGPTTRATTPRLVLRTSASTATTIRATERSPAASRSTSDGDPEIRHENTRFQRSRC